MSDLHQTVDDPAQKQAAPVSVETPPQQIGRYRVERLLGQGGFGVVYLAHDDRLQRLVAIKVPHARLVAHLTDAEAHLTEARTIAHLDHPHLVPVYDVGSTDQFPCYVVSKYIDGTDLASRLKQSRLSLHEAVELVATVAEALHHAHKQGLVHRDIKPSNILLDRSGKPFVGDFGLALREQDIGKGPRFAGTPAYMSPEQARGEGHRVDGRSDIFSLGVVFYELLTGRRPFKADSQNELLDQIKSFEARPLRQIDDLIPKELERICLKALCKRRSERYLTSKDMAEDLRHFLADAPVVEKTTLTGVAAGGPRSSRIRAVTDLGSPVPTPSDPQPVKIVPKGLRSFDATDANFFLELLPGPRDREGLPDSIRFWKARIEAADADSTFAVGLIYGPSGCGKSSLVKAGLLPRLAKAVTAVYLETTAADTEARLLKGLQRRVAALPSNLGLIEALAALRRGQFLESGQKILLVLDQFEQWLHANRNQEKTELVQALRQCDGQRLQCVVMVRDDFWLAVSRFMQTLEIRIVEGENSRLVDLFDPRHARKVLTAFGRALGALPEGSIGKEQGAFLDQAVAGLAQEGKVVSVRLALFAEMVKGKSWTPGTLKEMGGTEGVGVTFLEETFTASTAPPHHRLRQKAAQAVLKALLPEAGTDIKGHMRSQQELLAASGYAGRPRDFDDLVRILDGEIRVITPTEAEDANAAASDSLAGSAEPPSEGAGSHEKYYQLTHDYLVPSLRDWLTRKQKETRRGRAEFLLADRAAVWNARPENRQLPSLLQWLQIRWLTAKKNWTPQQQKMMRRAGRYHAVRSLAVAIAVVVLALTGLGVRNYLHEQDQANHAAALVQRLQDANITQVPGIIAEMEAYRPWADPLLRAQHAQAADDSPQKLRTSLALLPVDVREMNFLYERLLTADASEVRVIRDALEQHKTVLTDRLWVVVEQPAKGKEAQRLRAAAALAKYDPENEKWATAQEHVGNDLVMVPAVHLSLWMDVLRPVRTNLLPQLSVAFRDAARRDVERSLAADILADYAADNPPLLADLLMEADEKQFAVIYPKFKERAEQGLPVLRREIDRTLPRDAKDDDKEKLAKRQVNAAAALLKMDQPDKVWPLLKHTPDPRARSYLIHRFCPLGVEAAVLIDRLDDEPDNSIRRALLLSLGEYGERELSPEDRTALVPRLQEIYRTDADPGLHAAAEWLLRTWKQQPWLNQVNEEWARDKKQRDKRLDDLKQSVVNAKEKLPPQWYVNTQGQTMVVFPGPIQFQMGAPPSEPGRKERERQHKRLIDRTFAIAAKSVTIEQYKKFEKNYRLDPAYDWTANLPAVRIDWYRAASYCNWLSQKEGIPETDWCYETNPKGRAGPKVEVVKLKANYLSLRGYRLPSEAEMEYATRAEAATARYYGETEELLPKYAWYLKNAQETTQPVGSLKPNDFGLFDVHGNVLTWCQEGSHPYPPGDEVKDQEGDLSISSTSDRILRGGSVRNLTSGVRSANRILASPTIRYNIHGFRPARTVLPGLSPGVPPTPEGGRE